MKKKRSNLKTYLAIAVAIILAQSSFVAFGDYEYVVTVGQDPNVYDCNTISCAIALMRSYDPNENCIGCIEVYEGIYEHGVENNSDHLPRYCDLIGMATNRNDVEIRMKEGMPTNSVVIVGEGNNYVNHLKINGYYTTMHGINLEQNGTINDCYVYTIHPAVLGGTNLVVENCHIITLTGVCVLAEDTFEVKNCVLEPRVNFHNIECATGILAKGSGKVENVTIEETGGSSTKSLGPGLYGICLKLDETETVAIKDTDINLSLTSNYNPGFPDETKAMRVSGIFCGTTSLTGSNPYKGYCDVVDCTININGIEVDHAETEIDAGIMVSGICIHGEGNIAVYGDTSITTDRTEVSSAEGGYQYLLKNDSGSLDVDFNTVSFNPNGDDPPDEYDEDYVAGAVEQLYKAKNVTWDANYVFLEDAIDEVNEGDVIEATEGFHFGVVDFNGTDFTLLSIDPDDWGVVESTILDAEGSDQAVLFNSGEDTDSVLSGFTVIGGNYGIKCNASGPIISRCIITDNNSHGVYYDGNITSQPEIKNCKIYQNLGDGINSTASRMPDVKNCWIYGNDYGISATSPTYGYEIYNNTIVDNINKGIYHISGANPIISSCILWGNNDDLYNCNATYSCIEDGDVGEGNITGDANAPVFLDPNCGDYHIQPYWSGVDAGYPDYIPDEGETDIDGEKRIMGVGDVNEPNAIIDMGADEVTADVHNVTQDMWYLTIQDAIDLADSCDIIEIKERIYDEEITFNGDEITLKGKDPGSWDTISETVINDGFRFNNSSTSVIKGITIKNNPSYAISSSNPEIRNCIIENSTFGISCYESSAKIINNIIRENTCGVGILGTTAPMLKNNLIYNNDIGIRTNSTDQATIINNTIVDNTNEGISVINGQAPEISNCIIWDNGDDLYDCNATYSCISDSNDIGDPNITHNINSDPLFVDPNNDDYDLDINSPCVNTGDPNYEPDDGETDIDGEPRIMGACNATVDMGADEWFFPDCWHCPTQCHGDADCDGYAGENDLDLWAAAFLSAYGYEDYNPCADFNRDGSITSIDLMEHLYPNYETYPDPNCVCSCNCPTQCHGDADCDGYVGDDDLDLVIAAFGSAFGQEDYNPCADFNNDGQITSVDVMDYLYPNYGTYPDPNCECGGTWPPE